MRCLPQASVEEASSTDVESDPADDLGSMLNQLRQEMQTLKDGLPRGGHRFDIIHCSTLFVFDVDL